MNSKKYNNTKLASGIIEAVLTFILIFLFVKLGYSLKLENHLLLHTANKYLILLLFTAITGFAMGVLFFPINFYTEFYLEHKYKLSNQTFWKWIWEDLKALLISIVIGVPVLLIFYWAINFYGNNWWLPFAIFLFFLSVVLARIVPVFILPMLYKLTPIENEILKRKIELLAVECKLKVDNVFSFDMSKNTKKANAAFTGLGKSKRILLGDTLLNNYSIDEIETVLAHEFGHYKKKHIIKNIFIGTFFSFGTLYFIAYFYKESLSYFQFTQINQIAALPVLTLWGMLIALIITPITNKISRAFEYQADKYAVEQTNNPFEFISALKKLTEQNLGDKEPHPIVEWFFYSHPSINKRIDAIKKYSEEQKTIKEFMNVLRKAEKII